MNPNYAKKVKEEIDNLLKAGFITEVESSNWLFPIVVVSKKNGKHTVCVDYRKLNAQTIKDPFPLPFTDMMLDQIAGHEMYSFMDGYNGPFQYKIRLCIAAIAEASQVAKEFVDIEGESKEEFLSLHLETSNQKFLEALDAFGLCLKRVAEEELALKDEDFEARLVELGIEKFGRNIVKLDKISFDMGAKINLEHEGQIEADELQKIELFDEDNFLGRAGGSRATSKYTGHAFIHYLPNLDKDVFCAFHSQFSDHSKLPMFAIKTLSSFDFANESASEETPMLVNYLITRLQQAMANPALQCEVQQQLQAYGFIPPHQEERIPEKSLGETSKRGTSKVREGENPYKELQNLLLDDAHQSRRRGHAQRQEPPTKEKERSESPDESMEEDVAPRRHRVQRSPTPTKRKRSPHSPPRRESKKEEKDTKKKKGEKEVTLFSIFE
ncbi:hypothetical protein L7F22_029028 [Adiantum nelumboides]|nr:hypothetical protein [Adiantum nelumboides]